MKKAAHCIPLNLLKIKSLQNHQPPAEALPIIIKEVERIPLICKDCELIVVYNSSPSSLSFSAFFSIITTIPVGVMYFLGYKLLTVLLSLFSPCHTDVEITFLELWTIVQRIYGKLRGFFLFYKGVS